MLLSAAGTMGGAYGYEKPGYVVSKSGCAKVRYSTVINCFLSTRVTFCNPREHFELLFLAEDFVT